MCHVTWFDVLRNELGINCSHSTSFLATVLNYDTDWIYKKGKGTHKKNYFSFLGLNSFLHNFALVGKPFFDVCSLKSIICLQQKKHLYIFKTLPSYFKTRCKVDILFSKTFYFYQTCYSKTARVPTKKLKIFKNIKNRINFRDFC